jgi:hypothetical protein
MIRGTNAFFRSVNNFSVKSSFNAARSFATNKPPLKEGDKVPQVTFKARVRDDSLGEENPFKWKDVTTNDLFANKRIVLFALPGGMKAF